MDSLISYIVGHVPNALIYAALPLLFAAAISIITGLWTTAQYYLSLRKFESAQHGRTKTVESPQLPYLWPWLGNALAFLNTTPGDYWDKVFRWYPRENGIMTILMAGRRTHVVFGSAPVQALFKAKSPNRDFFERDLFEKVFEMPVQQIDSAAAGKHFEVEMNAKYMTNFDKVNELTAKFTQVLDDVLSKDADEIVKLSQVGLYEWLRDRMFTASVTALMGEKLIPMYPNWCEDFFAWDNDFLGFFFGIPAFLQREADKRRKRIYASLEKWSLEMHRLSGGAPVDPDGPAWEPIFGSRLNRARQLDYKNRGLDSRSGARLDAGITFGLATNVIPATGWMLFNIVNPNAPPTLLPRVLAEIKEAQKEDGSLDVVKLVGQPLLQSIWIEALRLYSDLLVVRSLPEDITLPLDEDGKLQVYLRKGDNIFAPSYIPQHDDSWSGKLPWDVFDSDRFLAKDPKTGTTNFVFSKSAGKFFPFGGGKTICPGRIFAKQEAIGALAMILSRFEFEVLGFVNEDKQETKDFPGFKKAYPGSGALSPGGDLSVKIRRRIWQLPG
ncbi:putative cytochrome P450 [Septoria linicola]|nr:putative cytochrome P450 [Septoria linicola]